MSWYKTYDNGKAVCLVFTFTEQLLKDDDLFAPQPDFLKWLDKTLFVDLGTAGDEIYLEKTPAKEREAWKLFHDAIQSTGDLMRLYDEDLRLFQKIARKLMFLPCFLSLHPDNPRFNRVLLKNSGLSQDNMEGAGQPKGMHLSRQSWPVRYAYAIVMAIGLTLDTYETRLPEWAKIYGYGIKYPISLSEIEAAADRIGLSEMGRRKYLLTYQDSYRILPVWTKGIEKLRRPFNVKHVQDYWKKGKEIILEEMPEFHLRPEWKKYRENRNYKDGAKKGAVQHAIFRDILTALKTIAAVNNRRTASKQVTK